MDLLNIIFYGKGKVAIDKIKNYIEIHGVYNIEQLDKLKESYKDD